MYFCIDEEQNAIISDDGVSFSVDDFKRILDEATEPIDMTLSCQRLVRFGFDWDRLAEFYKS